MLLSTNGMTQTTGDLQGCNEDVATFDVPHVIQLFTIDGIATNYCGDKDKDSSQADPFQLLVSELKDNRWILTYFCIKRYI